MLNQEIRDWVDQRLKETAERDANKLKEKKRREELEKEQSEIRNMELLIDYDDAVNMKRLLIVFIDQFQTVIKQLEDEHEDYSHDSRKRCNFERFTQFLNSRRDSMLSQYEEICHFTEMYKDDDQYIHKRCLGCFLRGC